MKKFLALLLLAVVYACSNSFERTEATVTDLEVNYEKSGNFRATYEYIVDSTTYTGTFEITVLELAEDSLAAPAPGTIFEVEYNPSKPSENMVNYNVRPKSIN